ncbi:hypothetical protein Hanom_Chr11g00993521 [Helianthus anomalus]
MSKLFFLNGQRILQMGYWRNSPQRSLGNPPPVANHTLEEQVQDDTTEDNDLVSHKKQRVNPETSVAEHMSPTAKTKPVIQTEPKVVTRIAQENVIPYLFEMSLLETATRAEPESSSGLRFDVGGSSTEKMNFIEESDSDDDMDVDVVKLQKRVIVLEQDSLLKDAQISSVQDQVFNKDQTINKLQSDVNLLMSMVFDLKTKLEKKFG